MLGRLDLCLRDALEHVCVAVSIHPTTSSLLQEVTFVDCQDEDTCALVPDRMDRCNLGCCAPDRV